MKRNTDNLGRVVLPKQYRDELNIKEGEEVEIELKDNQLIVTNPKFTSSKSRKEIEDKIIKVKSMEDYQDNIIAHGFVAGLYWCINEGIEDVF